MSELKTQVVTINNCSIRVIIDSPEDFYKLQCFECSRILTMNFAEFPCGARFCEDCIARLADANLKLQHICHKKLNSVCCDGIVNADTISLSGQASIFRWPCMCMSATCKNTFTFNNAFIYNGFCGKCDLGFLN
jgi:hypothetical protein